jgi:RNA polymerase sigma-70 factor (ECF subfamily)
MHDWEQIVKSNARDVYRAALRILGNRHDAEDIAQDVFCEAAGLLDSASVNDWSGLLRRMATFRAIDCLRRRRPAVPADDVYQADMDPGQSVSQQEQAERIRQAIAELPEQQAAVFSLTYLESCSRHEIAEWLKISPEAVSTALYKARQRLKLLFETAEARDE